MDFKSSHACRKHGKLSVLKNANVAKHRSNLKKVLTWSNGFWTLSSLRTSESEIAFQESNDSEAAFKAFPKSVHYNGNKSFRKLEITFSLKN
jgi:hypothetical protein